MPRLGLATIDISTLGGSGGAVTGIDDFFFESFTAGQMHPIRTASRTNLILQSQTIRTSPWSLENFGTDTDLYSAPNSTTTAQSMSLETANDQVYAQQVISIVAGKTYTFSAHLKKGALDFSILLVYDSVSTFSHLSYFNIATGAAQGSGSNIIRSAVDAMDNGWYRCSITFQALSSVSGIFRVYASEASGSPATGSGTQVNIPVAYLWGTQIEENGFPSAYIPTVGSTVTVATTLNDTSNVWDFDGTDIMIAEDPEDEGFWEESYPDGATLPELVLNGDYEELGSDLVINGGFELNSDWNNFGSPTTSEQSTEQSHTGTYSWKIIADATQEGIFSPNNFNLTSGRTYSVSLWVYSVSGNSIKSGLNNTNVSVFTERTVTVGEWTNITYIATASSTGASYVSILSQNSLNFFVDNVSVKQVDPNDRWTLTGGASISDGKATVTGASGTTTIHVNPQTMLVEGTTYELTYTISNYSLSSGVTAVINNNGSTIQGISGNGTFTAIFTHAIPNGNLIFRATSGTNSYQLDNVSVKEYAIQPKDI